MITKLASRINSATVLGNSAATVAQKSYRVAQQVEYLYLEAEIDVLLRQLQSLQSQKVSPFIVEN